MNAKAIYIILFFLLPVGQQLLPAQDAILSQFYSHPLYLNPAFAGTQQDTRLVFNYRNHPLPDATNFSLLNASADGYVDALSGGLGLYVMSDYQGGLLWQNQVNAAYAYHLQMSRRWHVSFGLQAGYQNYSMRWDNLEFSNPGQTIPEPDHKHDMSFASGVLLFNDHFYGGLAVHHLVHMNSGFRTQDAFSPIKITIHAGYRIEPRKNRRANTLLFDYFVSPNLIVQNQGNFTRINYGLYAGVEQFMAGVWYRQDLKNPGALIFLLGLKRNNYRIGYSFDYALSGYADISHSVHEISVAFDLVNEERRLERKVLRGVGF